MIFSASDNTPRFNNLRATLALIPYKYLVTNQRHLAHTKAPAQC